MSFKLVEYSIVFIAFVVFALVLKNLQTFLRPLALAIILTLIFLPLIRWSEKKKIPYPITLAGVMTLIVCVVAGLIVLGSLFVVKSADFSENLPEDQQTSGWFSFEQIKIGDDIIDLTTFISPTDISAMITSAVQAVLKGLQGFFSELTLSIIFLVFLIPTYRQIMRSAEEKLSTSKYQKIETAVHSIMDSIKLYLTTKTVISLGTAVASAIILWLFGGDYVFVLALVIFMLNFIPTVGSIISSGIAIIVYFFKTGFSWELGVVSILLIVVQQFFGSYLEPKVSGKELKLSPLVILISLFLWYYIWGVVGMILAVPLTSIIKIVLENVETTRKFAKYMS